MRRFRIAFLVAAAVALSLVLGGSHQALGAATCLATDINDGFSSSDAQAVVDHANSGDTVTIAGTCGGVSVFSTNSTPFLAGTPTGNSLTLTGVGKAPTLAGGEVGVDMPIGPNAVTINNLTLTNAVVGVRNSVNNTVTINECKITGNQFGIIEFSNGVTMTINNTTISGNGSPSVNGGGIRNAGSGSVVLAGTTTVTKNEGAQGAGVFNDTGSTLTLLDSTRIIRNTATVDGGGIYNNHGTVNIASTAVVSRNKPNDIVNTP
jgi:hypothetical protein